MNETQKSSTGKSGLFPFPVIVAATSGDVDAINQVLKHYEGYICALSTRRLYDKNDCLHFCMDEELRSTLEARLITKILTFDVA